MAYICGVKSNSHTTVMSRRTKKQPITNAWVVTAVNELTGETDVVSLPMTRTKAIAAARRLIEDQAHDEFRCYRLIRIRQKDPQQLTLW